jgi:GMP synthase (glutamine-hydrolysing)
MRAVCLQYVPIEGPGAFASALMKHGISLECHLFPKNGLPQDPGDLLSMKDGPMSVRSSGT